MATARQTSRTLDARRGVASPGATSPERRARLSLLWWVFLANGATLLVAFLLLTFSPIEIDAPITIEQVAVLLAGLAVMLVFNVLVLRRVLSPFLRLTDLMASIDPDRPGRRLSGIDSRTEEGAALAATFNAMLDRLERARREAARTALAAQEAERARVARELHDEIGQTLTAVMLQAERAAGDAGELTSPELAGVVDGLRYSLDEVRRIARELRPEALDDLGLVNALIALCSRLSDQGGPRITRDLQPGLPALSPDVELVVYRVAQESLTNAIRHAGADHIDVSLAAEGEDVVLTVIDDGRGLPAQLPGDTSGIAGMRERSLLVGGELSIRSRPGEGTRVRLRAPQRGASA